MARAGGEGLYSVAKTQLLSRCGNEEASRPVVMTGQVDQPKCQLFHLICEIILFPLFFLFLFLFSFFRLPVRLYDESGLDFGGKGHPRLSRGWVRYHQPQLSPPERSMSLLGWNKSRE